MITTYKRKLIVVFILVFFMVFNFIACKEPEQIDNEETENSQQFSVNFIDVEDGECIIIKTLNGKCMLIDTGLKSTYQSVKDKLISLEINEIECLVLSNPSGEHVGAVEDLLNDFTVNKAYIPKILDLSLFYSFSKAKDALNSKNVSTEISYQNQYFLIDGMHVAFLSPSKAHDGPYFALNSQYSPNKYQIGNVSPIIYCEYNSVNFIFTGDADETQEEFVLDTYKNGIYEKVFSYKGLSLQLENVDFLKVSSGGDQNATSKQFLDTIKPKNAVISVSATNTECPSSSVISRITGSREDYGLYRTDVNGTIEVCVDENGEYEITTQR